MADATTATRLFRRLRLRAAPAEIDLADCGTAFGLDLALQPEPTPTELVPHAARSPGWWRRMGPRRLPATP
jgi:hypothetical protein